MERVQNIQGDFNASPGRHHLLPRYTLLVLFACSLQTIRRAQLEMKSSRSSLDRNVGTPDPFDGFFSFPANKGGYSGVAIYTDSRRLIPLKAEEGLSGSVQPKPPLSLEDHISRSYPCAHEMNLMPDENADIPSDWTSLDGEGRALVLDLGLFILINVYCPNETSDARLPFKMNYHFLLQERVNKLISEGREVIVVGDINICSAPLDHCDGHLASNAATFYDHPARAWFRDWIGPNGCMSDVLRMFWPDRKGMYTCTTHDFMFLGHHTYVLHFHRLEYQNMCSGHELWHPC